AGRFLAGALPQRPRPLEVLDLRLPTHVSPRTMREAMLVGRPDTSLPSTHAITGSAAGPCLFCRRPVLGAPVTLCAVRLLAPPVLYFGLPWPSDIAVSLAIAGCAGWLASRSWPRLLGPARRLDRVLERWPAASALTLCLVTLLVLWRVTPRTGILDAMTSAVRSLIGVL